MVVTKVVLRGFFPLFPNILSQLPITHKQFVLVEPSRGAPFRGSGWRPFIQRSARPEDIQASKQSLNDGNEGDVDPQPRPLVRGKVRQRVCQNNYRSAALDVRFLLVLVSDHNILL